MIAFILIFLELAIFIVVFTNPYNDISQQIGTFTRLRNIVNTSIAVQCLQFAV